MEESDSMRLKIIVVGDPSSGKTSSIHQFCDGIFDNNYQPTIGVEFSSKFISIDGKSVELRLWDIAGQDHYAGMSRVYYNGALGAIVMCDVTNKNSIEGAMKWKANIDDRVLFNNEKIPVLLVGNKTDLIQDEAQLKAIQYQLGEISASNGFSGYILTSARTSHNLEESMVRIAKFIITKYGALLDNTQPEEAAPNIDLMQFPETKKLDGCCH
ncbi:Rab family GTPase [Entamoeba histolytica]|nr:Rab family GTPase [Entamoeba histolytica]